MVMMVQVFGLSTGVTSDAVHVTVSRHGEMHFFHGRPFGFGVLVAAAAAVAFSKFYVIEQGLKPLERSRGSSHLRARQ